MVGSRVAPAVWYSSSEKPEPSPAVRLHQQGVAVLAQLGYAGGREAHAVFIVFNFLRNADNHEREVGKEG